jgi:hypothetical protein
MEGKKSMTHDLKQAFDLARNSGQPDAWILRKANGMDRSCEATIYPVLDKPRATGALQDRRKIKALLRRPSSFA